MSGAAEADLELGIRVNIDATRQVLDTLRRMNPGVRVVFTSTTAVYGPPPAPNFPLTEANSPAPLSSYGSQKVEPLNGQKSILPVSRDLSIWICSPRTVVENLIHARDIAAEEHGEGSRVVNLPGITVSIQEMLAALEAVGGQEALDLVEDKRDAATEKIVKSWPATYDTSKAKRLGFVEDGTLEQTLQQYMEDYRDRRW
ncbi:MAG: hypothetical protein L6R35_000135 [Caloplaca aegaea]|nr:MAG: hypothetical protein L6R35_000135 [Caloplaca aegaea]